MSSLVRVCYRERFFFSQTFVLFVFAGNLAVVLIIGVSARQELAVHRMITLVGPSITHNRIMHVFTHNCIMHVLTFYRMKLKQCSAVTRAF